MLSGGKALLGNSRVAREADWVGGTACCKSFSARSRTVGADKCVLYVCWIAGSCNLIPMNLYTLAQTAVSCGSFSRRHIVRSLEGLKPTPLICSP